MVPAVEIDEEPLELRVKGYTMLALHIYIAMLHCSSILYSTPLRRTATPTLEPAPNVVVALHQGNYINNMVCRVFLRKIGWVTRVNPCSRGWSYDQLA